MNKLVISPNTDKKIVTARFIFQDECPAQHTIKITLKNEGTQRLRWFRLNTTKTVGKAFILNKFFINDPSTSSFRTELIGPIPCWYFATGEPGELTGSTILPNETMTLEVTNTKRRKTMKFIAILTCWTYVPM